MRTKTTELLSLNSKSRPNKMRPQKLIKILASSYRFQEINWSKFWHNYNKRKIFSQLNGNFAQNDTSLPSYLQLAIVNLVLLVFT